MENGSQLEKHLGILRLLVGLTATFSVALFILAVVILGLRGAGVLSPRPAVGEVDTPSGRADQPEKMIDYGRELIAHTSRYLGPAGSVTHISNGLNCQNCHLDAGTRPFGNNYLAVAATYPKFRARSGNVESIEKRVNDCFERSLNGKALDTASREMRAIVAYIRSVGRGVTSDNLPEGIGLKPLAIMKRAADPARGREIYERQCAACHGRNGAGMPDAEGREYQFPPLWGSASYNDGAGMYRLSNLARFIFVNMPLGATHESPILAEDEAWDIAAYVNSLPRPHKNTSADWPQLDTKPFDHPFGPFADPYSEARHKFGPFREIQEFYSTKRR